ncbi:ATP-binding protein [Streptomyces sp. NPDC127068]|uniref:ATP-binding protein n=1 Tax=Streptomyces sp. NPDC127068 TaxID=3347127 RepID=UPI003658B318
MTDPCEPFPHAGYPADHPVAGRPGGEPPCPLRADEARALTHRLLQGLDPPPHDNAIADAVLVTHELVANAIRHGGGLTALSVTADMETICVAVSDLSVALPVARPRDGLEEGGYGWPMVCAIAGTRGVSVSSRGKTITVSVPLR